MASEYKTDHGNDFDSPKHRFILSTLCVCMFGPKHVMKVLILHAWYTAETNENWAMLSTTWALLLPMARSGRVWPAGIKQTVEMTSTHQSSGFIFFDPVCMLVWPRTCHESTHIACLVHSRDKLKLGDDVYNLGSPVAYGPGRTGVASKYKPDRGNDFNSPKHRFYSFDLVCMLVWPKTSDESTHIACFVDSRDKLKLGDDVYNLGSPVAYGPGRTGVASKYKPDRVNDFNSPKLRFYSFDHVCMLVWPRTSHESTHTACFVHTRDKRELGDDGYDLGSPGESTGVSSRYEPGHGDDLCILELRFYVLSVVSCIAMLGID